MLIYFINHAHRYPAILSQKKAWMMGDIHLIKDKLLLVLYKSLEDDQYLLKSKGYVQ